MGTTRPKPTRRRAALVQLLFGLVLVLAVWWSWQAVARSPEAMPRSLGPLHLTTEMSGEEALAQVNQLHGLEMDLAGAEMGHYAGDEGRLDVWVGRAAGPAQARDLLDRMVEAIADGTPVFSNLRQSTLDGHAVYLVDGLGAVHFFYASGERVVWLAVYATDPLPIARLAVEAF